MKNWIRIGNHWINMDQIVDIITDEKRRNYDKPYEEGYFDKDNNWHEGGRPLEPCVIFVCATSETIDEYGGRGSREIKFFGSDRENVLAWLYNDVEMEVTNLNFVDMEPAK